jgi:hypothetical protein
MFLLDGLVPCWPKPLILYADYKAGNIPKYTTSFLYGLHSQIIVVCLMCSNRLFIYLFIYSFIHSFVPCTSLESIWRSWWPTCDILGELGKKKKSDTPVKSIELIQLNHGSPTFLWQRNAPVIVGWVADRTGKIGLPSHVIILRFW